MKRNHKQSKLFAQIYTLNAFPTKMKKIKDFIQKKYAENNKMVENYLSFTVDTSSPENCQIHCTYSTTQTTANKTSISKNELT